MRYYVVDGTHQRGLVDAATAGAHGLQRHQLTRDPFVHDSAGLPLSLFSFKRGCEQVGLRHKLMLRLKTEISLSHLSRTTSSS